METIDRAVEAALDLLEQIFLLERLLTSKEPYEQFGNLAALPFVRACEHARQAIVPVLGTFERTASRSAKVGVMEAPTAHELVLWFGWQRERALRRAARQDTQTIPSEFRHKRYLCGFCQQYDPTEESIHAAMMEIRDRQLFVIVTEHYTALQTQLRQEATAASNNAPGNHKSSGAPPGASALNRNQTSAPNLLTTEKLADDAWLSPSDIAKRFQSRTVDTVSKRLERWRSKNSEGWREVTDRKPREAQYLYRWGDVKDLFEPSGESRAK
ncbi:MAG: hypothetical protein WAN65_10310 [Candidatus Sulfotelmatobacter sp.]